MMTNAHAIRRRRRAYAAVAMLALVTTVAGGCRDVSPQKTSTRQPAPLDFSLTDMNGARLNLASLKGRPILLNVWATYCGPCKIETPDLVAMYEKYKDNGFIVVGVSFADTATDMKQFAADHRITYPLLMGTDALESAYETIGIPTSWFIRRDGTINETRVGLGSTDELERSIRALF
jgi:peroxiredoxin